MRQLPLARLLTCAALLLATPAAAQQDPPAWTRPIAPFAIVGPVDYVGTEGLGAYLVRTSAGAILIDATLAANVPAIERGIVARGVPLRSVRYILVSHAHFDHVEGLARLQRDTGARVIAGAGDVAALRTGRSPGQMLDGDSEGTPFPAVANVAGIADGGRVTLGGTTLVARSTPGHTPGCTSWSLHLATPRPADVLLLCSLTVAGNRLVGNRRYPAISADFRRSLAAVPRWPADIVLTFHPELTDVLGRRDRAAGDPDAWRTPGLAARIAREATVAFEAEYRRQQGLPRR